MTSPVARVAVAFLIGVALVVPVGERGALAADEYSMDTDAAYVLQPKERRVDVTIEVEFTNTTPDPPGQFSVFEEVKLAVHDGAASVEAEDEDGSLEVSVAPEDDVSVATVQLRQPVRFEQSVSFTLAYELRDGTAASVTIRSAVASFPVWGFGTSSSVTVQVAGDFDVGVDGDGLTATRGGDGLRLESGQIDDPVRWLAVVTVSRPGTYVTLSELVPLAGGTADLQVRAWDDDEGWGERTLALLSRALPVMEREMGLPYPRVAPLIVTEVAGVGAGGFAEGEVGATELQIDFEQPEFTLLHQVAHVWLNETLLERRWLLEGLASHIAERVADEIELDVPFDPDERTAELDSDAFPLDAWTDDSPPTARGDDYGYAASWSVIDQIVAEVGPEAISRILVRASAGVDGYEPPRPEGRVPNATQPRPIDSRAFLDHLQSVADADLEELFAGSVFTDPDLELLAERAAAREAYLGLLADSGDWEAPDPVRDAMAAWRFEEARPEIDAARAWIRERDELLAAVETAGLSVPDRLKARYRESGGGPESQAELQAHRGVVDAYRGTLERVNGERSLVERVGMLGGPDPAVMLTAANGAYAEGDLLSAADSIASAQRTIDGAHMGGLARLASALVLLVLLAAAAVLLLRRRSHREPVAT